MFVRYCPACRTDYMPGVERCADCGGALVTRLEDDPLPPPLRTGEEEEPAAWQPPPGDYRRLHAASFVSELEPLVARLAQSRIPSRIESVAGGFELHVRIEEREAARSALGELLAEHTAAEEALARHFDSEVGYARCPACDASLPSRAHKCPECGLSLGGEAATCPECEGELEPATGRCPRCAPPGGGEVV